MHQSALYLSIYATMQVLWGNQSERATATGPYEPLMIRVSLNLHM
jgi:hypothetical protein